MLRNWSKFGCLRQWHRTAYTRTICLLEVVIQWKPTPLAKSLQGFIEVNSSLTYLKIPNKDYLKTLQFISHYQQNIAFSFNVIYT